jgi:hypothetical protein
MLLRSRSSSLLLHLAPQFSAWEIEMGCALETCEAADACLVPLPSAQQLLAWFTLGSCTPRGSLGLGWQKKLLMLGCVPPYPVIAVFFCFWDRESLAARRMTYQQPLPMHRDLSRGQNYPGNIPFAMAGEYIPETASLFD